VGAMILQNYYGYPPGPFTGLLGHFTLELGQELDYVLDVLPAKGDTRVDRENSRGPTLGFRCAV
jgi:hypothetical protein